MAEINLLPKDLSPNRGSYKFVIFIRKATLYVAGIFLFTALLSVIFIVYLTSQLNASIVRQTSLKQKIQALQQTEQKLFLIKDRADKIKLALADANVADSLTTINKTLANLPDNVSINDVTISSTKGEFSVISKDSVTMAAFLNAIVVSGIYKQLTLTGFVFTPTNGYLISFAGS